MTDDTNDNDTVDESIITASNSLPEPYTKGFGIISSLSDGLGLYTKNFTTFTILMIVYQLALYSITYTQSGTFAATSPTIMEDGFSSYLITLLVSTAVGTLTSMAILFGALCSLGGRQINISTMLSRAINIWPRAYVAQFLAVILTVIGIIIFIVPGVMIAMMFLPLGAVLAWENIGVMASLDRSRTLTNGYKWSLLGLSLLIFIPVLAFGIIAGVSSASALQAPTSLPTTVITIILTAMFSAAMNSIIAVVYSQLKNENG